MGSGGVRVDLSAHQLRELKFLSAWGYGPTEADVIRYLVERGLDDLRRSRVIPPYCECGSK